VVATPGALGIGTPATATLARACGRAPGIACRLVWDLSHSAHAADFTSVYLAGPIRLTLRILLVLVIAVALRMSATRLIGRIMARSVVGPDRADRPHVVFGERRRQRATALASILRNAASLTIFTVAGLIILGDLGLNLAPVLASAGVLGIAIGLGAQSLVQDFLAGIFILLEDQYGVGDVIEVSAVTGTVEATLARHAVARQLREGLKHALDAELAVAPGGLVVPGGGLASAPPGAVLAGAVPAQPGERSDGVDGGSDGASEGSVPAPWPGPGAAPGQVSGMAEAGPPPDDDRPAGNSS
jgi:hypothetical protein